MNKEMNQNIVYDFTKFTTTDYEGEIALVVWHIGCNLRCSYCYNDKLVFSKTAIYSHSDILDFLKKRRGLLSAVVLSGGEATMHDLAPFCRELKKMGFKVKLDTNGMNFKQIKELIEENLIDFISLDFKAPKDKYFEITAKNSYVSFYKTLEYLINLSNSTNNSTKFAFELRTTISTLLLDESDINTMIEELFCIGYSGIFYIQNFLETPSNIGNIKISRAIDESLINSEILTIKYRN